MWKSEPESVKSTFKDMAKRKEAEHKQAYPEYKYTPRVTEKSIKARQKAKGLKRIATGKVQTDLSAVQGPSSHSPRSTSPKRQRYPPPQASPRRSLRSARGQGSPGREEDFRRSLSPMREAARPYPTLSNSVDAHPAETRAALQAPDDGNVKGLRRSPRFKQAAVEPFADTNDTCANTSPAQGTAEETQEVGAAKVDELMQNIVKPVEAQRNSPPEVQVKHGAIASASSSILPWSPPEATIWTGDDDRAEFDYDMHSYLADQSLEGSYAAGSVIENMDSSTVDIASPSHAAMGFFAPFDEAGNDGDRSIVDILCSDRAHLDSLLRSDVHTVGEGNSPWRRSDCEQDLSFEYLSADSSGMKYDNLIELQDVSWRKRRHPHDVSTNTYEEKSSRGTTQWHDRQSLQDDDMSYTCSSPVVDRQNSTQTITRNNASQSDTNGDRIAEHSSAFIKSELLLPELQDFSLPLELVDFSFDHRDREVADGIPSPQGPCKEDTVVNVEDDSMITWADTEGTQGQYSSECAPEQLRYGDHQTSPTHGNSSPLWTRQHANFARFLLRQAGQEDALSSVSSPGYTPSQAGLHGGESGSVSTHRAFDLGDTIEPGMTLTHGAAMPKQFTAPLQRRAGGRPALPSAAKHDFINSALPRSAQAHYPSPRGYDTSDTTASSPSSPMTSRISQIECTTSPMLSTLANGPTSRVGERARQWEAMTEQSRQASRSPATHRSDMSRASKGESLQVASPAPVPSTETERLELNGFYTEEELMDMLARRRLQRAEGRERER